MSWRLTSISSGFLKRHESDASELFWSFWALSQICFLCPHKIWARCWVQGLLVVVVGWREGRHRGGVYGACNPCPWGLERTGGASMELISNSMELWKSENATKDFFGQLAFNVTKHTLPPATAATSHPTWTIWKNMKKKKQKIRKQCSQPKSTNIPTAWNFNQDWRWSSFWCRWWRILMMTLDCDDFWWKCWWLWWQW